ASYRSNPPMRPVSGRTVRSSRRLTGRSGDAAGERCPVMSAPMERRVAIDPLCLVFERVREDVFEPEFVADGPLVRFEAYADDNRLFGWVRLRADRLTDLLNGLDRLRLVNAEVESLIDGKTRTVDDVVVQRRQLI